MKYEIYSVYSNDLSSDDIKNKICEKIAAIMIYNEESDMKYDNK